MNLQTREILAEMGDDVLETARNLEILLGYKVDVACASIPGLKSSFVPSSKLPYYWLSGPGPGFVKYGVTSLAAPNEFTRALHEALEHEGLTPTKLRMKMELKGDGYGQG